MLIAFFATAIADTGSDTGCDTAPDPEATCEAAWQLAADHLAATGDTASCGVFDPATDYDPATGFCQFFCGDDDHSQFVGSLL